MTHGPGCIQISIFLAQFPIEILKLFSFFIWHGIPTPEYNQTRLQYQNRNYSYSTKIIV